jgi:hypothetical protein
MADRDIAAFGLFPDRTSLERAVSLLRGAGFRNSDVSMLMQETPGTKDLAHETHTKAPEGATAGAAAGAVVGGITGWLSASESWRFQGLDHSSPRARSWPR